MSDEHPETNGRAANGQFLRGHAVRSPGNPQIAQLAAWRSAFARAVSADDMEAVVRSLVESAKSGDLDAIKILLDRTLGKPVQPIDVDLAADVRTAVAQVRIVELPANGRDRLPDFDDPE